MERASRNGGPFLFSGEPVGCSIAKPPSIPLAGAELRR